MGGGGRKGDRPVRMSAEGWNERMNENHTLVVRCLVMRIRASFESSTPKSSERQHAGASRLPPAGLHAPERGHLSGERGLERGQLLRAAARLQAGALRRATLVVQLPHLVGVRVRVKVGAGAGAGAGAFGSASCVTDSSAAPCAVSSPCSPPCAGVGAPWDEPGTEPTEISCRRLQPPPVSREWEAPAHLMGGPTASDAAASLSNRPAAARCISLEAETWNAPRPLLCAGARSDRLR